MRVGEVLTPTIKFLDIYRQDGPIREEINTAISQVIGDSAYIGGQYVKQFTSAFAKFQQADYCVGVGNGTDALEIILHALELPLGSEVLVPANSFIASAEAVTRSGLKVVFCDCDPVTYTIDIDDAVKRITNNTAVIMPVHMYGHPCDMNAVLELAARYDLQVVEDCAQAHGAEYKGKKVGTFGIAGAFSFYPGKNLGAYGDAGAIITNNERLADRCIMVANHGRTEKYNHEFEGRNSRLDGMQAAILNIKLKALEQWTECRRNLARCYQELLNDSTVSLPTEQKWAKHVWHLFVIRSNQRDRLRSLLIKEGIQCGIHYPVALPDLPAYQYIEHKGREFRASKYADELLSLPIGPHLRVEDIERVSEVINEL